MGQDLSCYKGVASRAPRKADGRPNGAVEARASPTQLDLEESEEDSHPQAQLGPDGLPSVGSAGHDAGECKRCAFYPKDRCQNGHACKFCHYDHEAGKRKKKRGSGSTRTTPLSEMVGTLGAVPGTAPLLMPGSPPPAGPPATELLESGAAQVPPAPAVAPSVTLSTAPPAQSIESQAVQAGVAPVTLDDLFRMSAAPATAAGTVPTADASAQESQMLYWQQQAAQFYPNFDWSSYYQNGNQYDEYYAAAYAAALAEQAGYGAMPIYDSEGNKDSPRSVLLTLCGAWGALKGSDGNEQLVSEASGPAHSRDTLLAYRHLVPEQKSGEAATLMVTTKKVAKNGSRRGKTG